MSDSRERRRRAPREVATRSGSRPAAGRSGQSSLTSFSVKVCGATNCNLELNILVLTKLNLSINRLPEIHHRNIGASAG